MIRIRTTVITVAGLALLACGGSDGAPLDPSANAPTRTEAQLSFLRFAPGAKLSRDSVSFWAVRGIDREVSMYFRPAAGKSDSVRFLRFKVGGASLLRRPDGSAFAFGDSIRITIRIRDSARVITEYSPSGLQFNPAEPADLRLDFGECDEDYDRDGVVNQADTLRIASFAIWKQEFAGQPWVRLSSRAELSGDLREVEAEILSFTNHAIRVLVRRCRLPSWIRVSQRRASQRGRGRGVRCARTSLRRPRTVMVRAPCCSQRPACAPVTRGRQWGACTPLPPSSSVPGIGRRTDAS